MQKFSIERAGLFIVKGSLHYEIEAETAKEAAAKVFQGAVNWDKFIYRNMFDTEHGNMVEVKHLNSGVLILNPEGYIISAITKYDLENE